MNTIPNPLSDFLDLACAIAAHRQYPGIPKRESPCRDNGYGPFAVHARVSLTPRKLKNSQTFGKKLACKAKEPGQGKTNGLPWDTTSPCTVSTRPDNGPVKKLINPEPRWDQQLEAAQASRDWATVAKLALVWGERTSDTPEISAYLMGVLEHALKMRFES